MARLSFISNFMRTADNADGQEKRNLRWIARYADKALALDDDKFRASLLTKELFEELCLELTPVCLEPASCQTASH